MSYGTDFVDMFNQIGVYTGKILKGAQPPTCRSCSRTKKFVLNLSTARARGIEVPPSVLATADEVIE
jgi:putative ABC transport system substrate-binding protein